MKCAVKGSDDNRRKKMKEIIHHRRKNIPVMMRKTINPRGDMIKGNNLCR